MSIKTHVPFVEGFKKTEDDGTTRTYQRLVCSAEGCECHKDFPVIGRPKPAEPIYKSARQAGWSITKKVALCPEHSGKRRTAKEKVPMPQLTPDLRRAIFRAIDNHYDEAAQCYRGIITDEIIAGETGATVDDVASVREENFGPADNPIFMEVAARLAEAEKKRDQATAMIADGKAMLDKVNAEIEAITELLTKG